MHTAQLFVKPAKVGRRVHFPGREEGLAEAGELVPADHYWCGRLSDGAVVACEPPASAAPEGEGATDEDAQQPPPTRGGKKKRKKGEGATDEDAQE